MAFSNVLPSYLAGRKRGKSPMVNFFERVFGRSNKGTSSTAKDRLQLILVHDRIKLPPEQLEAMKEEILQVISKYVSIERDKVDIALEQADRDSSRIVAEIPFSPDRSMSVDLLGGQTVDVEPDTHTEEAIELSDDEDTVQADTIVEPSAEAEYIDEVLEEEAGASTETIIEDDETALEATGSTVISDDMDTDSNDDDKKKDEES